MTVFCPTKNALPREVKSSKFPNTIAGVIYQPGAFDVVADGQINMTPDSTAKKAAAGSGEPVICGTTGKVWKITSKEGDAVKSGDTILILEAMKMEIPVVAPQDGTVASIDVAVGDAIEAGQALATLN